jgi:sulfofructose kinase
MRIGCLGITVLDRVQLVTELPTMSGKFVSKGYFEIGGGPAATASVAVAKLGHDVEFIGRVGSDSVADIMIKELNDWGVETNNIVRINNAASAFSTVLVDDEGERMIVNHQDAALSRDIEVLKNVDFSQFDAILCDVRWPEGAKYALEQAKKFNIPSVLDADVSPEPIDELVELADHVAFAEPGLAKYAGTNDPAEGLHIASTKSKGTFYVTVGAEGCYWFEDGEIKHQPSIKVNAVDTTGAGDTFHGALTVAIAEKMETRAAVTFSNTVAAIKCTKLGGRDGIPSRQTVNDFLA